MSTNTNTTVITLSECSEWIQVDLETYVRAGWKTWAFYNRPEAARLIQQWERNGYELAA